MVAGNGNNKISWLSLEDNDNKPELTINTSEQKYPFCIVWTPIPLLTWFFPFVGHMGIAMSSGVIRDFALPYGVRKGDLAFGKPTRYLRLDPLLAVGGVEGWDKAIVETSEIFENKNHILSCENCYTYVGFALSKMHYKNSSKWNMVKLAALVFIFGKYASCCGFLKTWIPFVVILSICVLVTVFFSMNLSIMKS